MVSTCIFMDLSVYSTALMDTGKIALLIHVIHVLEAVPCVQQLVSVHAVCVTMYQLLSTTRKLELMSVESLVLTVSLYQLQYRTTANLVVLPVSPAL